MVINAEKIRVTGNKAEQKVYYRHTGYPGGIRTTSFAQMMEKHPERILRTAVRGMLPRTPSAVACSRSSGSTSAASTATGPSNPKCSISRTERV